MVIVCRRVHTFWRVSDWRVFQGRKIIEFLTAHFFVFCFHRISVYKLPESKVGGILLICKRIRKTAETLLPVQISRRCLSGNLLEHPAEAVRRVESHLVGRLLDVQDVIGQNLDGTHHTLVVEIVYETDARTGEQPGQTAHRESKMGSHLLKGQVLMQICLHIFQYGQQTTIRCQNKRLGGKRGFLTDTGQHLKKLLANEKISGSAHLDKL